MPAQELRIANRTAYFRKAITSPDFNSERVLVHDAFEFAELWLRRSCKDALPFWRQARSYYEASRHLPPASAPLTLYYCMLNAAKALLLVKGHAHADYHGIKGEFSASKRALQNEVIRFQNGGVIFALSQYLQEPEASSQHTLKDALSNMPFIHRAFRHTYRSHPEIFIPIRNIVYRKHPTEDRVWVTAEINGRYADARSLKTLPSSLEHDRGYSDRTVIRTKKRADWCKRGSSQDVRSDSMVKLCKLHQQSRLKFTYIASSPDLWYLKRSVASSQTIDRYNLTLIIAAMHRLSELSRYDPSGLMTYLESQSAWLLAEFIRLSPVQFIDELVCEMTGLEFASPGIRPVST